MSTPLSRWAAPTHPYTNIPLTLLTGVGRSGTTALRESLGQHPDLHSTERENNVIYDIIDAAHRNTSVSSRRYAMRVTESEFAAAFQQLLLSILWPSVRTQPPSRLFAFSNLSPQIASYLTCVFPDIKILHIIRNGIEVVASRMRFDSFKHLSFESHAAVWNQTAELARWGHTRSDFHLIRHEKLIAPGGADTELRRIFAFLGIKPHDDCARELSGTTYHPTTDGQPGQTGQATTLPAQSIHQRLERWRQWSEPQIRLFTERCAEAMAYFGYSLPWQSAASIASDTTTKALTRDTLIEPRQPLAQPSRLISHSHDTLPILRAD